jgi:hypothetical protein
LEKLAGQGIREKKSMIFLIMKLRKTLKKGVIMPMSLSHKSVKKHNKKCIRS